MIRQAEDGAILRVRVSAGAREDAITGRHGDVLKVRVQTPPEKGKANRSLALLLAAAVGARTSDVEVVRGATSRDKSLLFRGWSAAALRERILGILGGR